MATAARNAQKRKASEVQLAYRLAGHTVLPLSSDRTAVRFDTCYNGEYFEQYYVVLEFKSGSVDVSGAGQRGQG